MKLPGAQALRSRYNNFDLLRLAAAFFVLFSHSFGALNPPRQDWLNRFTNGRYPMSALGLMIFFTISGYLVTESLLNSQSIYQYIWNRFLRIWPACFVITLLTVFVLGPIVSSFSLASYFSDPLTWKFLFKNTVIVSNPKRLPGVFDGGNVNISLWTLPVEIRLYAILLVLYLCSFFRYRWLQGILFILIAIAKISWPAYFIQNEWCDLGFFFIAGSTLYTWRDKIKLHYAGILILAIVWLLCRWINFGMDTAAAIFFTYTILYIGLKLPVFFKPPIDISYGIYLYSTPVLLTAVWITHHNLSIWVYCFGVIPFIVLLGYLSWKLVESKALRLKTKWNKDK